MKLQTNHRSNRGVGPGSTAPAESLLSAIISYAYEQGASIDTPLLPGEATVVSKEVDCTSANDTHPR